MTHTYEFATEQMKHDQELYRARAIIAVAERDEKSISKTLREYGVATSIIKEIGFDVDSYAPKAKKATSQQIFEQWCKNNIGKTINGGKQIAEDTGFTYQSANNFIQSRRDIFSKIKKGQYVVKDPMAERMALKGNQ